LVVFATILLYHNEEALSRKIVSSGAGF